MDDAEKATRIHELICVKMDEGMLLAEAFDSVIGKGAFKQIAVQRFDQIAAMKEMFDKP